MAADNPSTWIPMRWPSVWKDPALLELMRETRINCLVFDDAAALGSIGKAAVGAKLATLVWSDASKHGIAAAPLGEMQWQTKAPVLAIADATWPGIRVEHKGGAQGGPTGAPWVDANGWSIQLARVRAPEKSIWLASAPPDKTFALRPRSYVLAATEAGAHGARWLVTLDSEMASALAARDTGAMKQWREVARAIDFFESHREWRDLSPDASLGAVSDFAGSNEFMATEFLNLAARRNLLYRILLKTRPLNLAGLTSVIYLDEQPPTGELLQTLTGFVKNGGLLIARSPLEGGRSMPCDIPGYRMSAVGKGRVASPVAGWDDPWTLAADAQILAGRRDDPVRLFNPGGLDFFVQSAPARQIVHLINYNLARAGDEKTLAPREHFATARFISFDQPPVPLTFVRRPKVNDELPLPRFTVYGAVEMEK